jgi:hypothetical protein
MSFRLFSLAPLITNVRLGSTGRRFLGISMDFFPER